MELPLSGNFNVYQQHVLLKLRKSILKYTLNKYHVHSRVVNLGTTTKLS